MIDYARILVGLLFIVCATAVAGPPMDTEDPGILDPGTWEIIVASTATSIKNGGDAYEFPILDVSYGLTESVQISATYPYVWVDPVDGSSDSDFGNLEVALKWRFWNSERLQLAFAPVHSFGVNVTRAELGFGDDNDATFIPISMEAALIGELTLTAQLGYVRAAGATDGWVYGAYLGHPAGARVNLYAEIFGSSLDDSLDTDFLNFNLGLDIALTDRLALLFSGGSGLREPDGEDELDHAFFLGLQYVR